MLRKHRSFFRFGFIFACLILLSGLLLAGGPDPITLTINQGTIQEGKVTVNGTFVGSLEGRQLILAVYDTEGKMTDLTSIITVDEAGNWSKELNANSLISGLKAFLLDTSVKPVIDAQGLHRSAMILKIASAGIYSGYYEEVQVLPSVTGQVVFEDMQVRGNLTITEAQQVIFKGNSMVTGSLKLQKASGLPTEVILLDHSRVNTLENLGAAGAVFMSLTETQTTLPTIMATENLQLINTSANTVNLSVGQAQNLKLGLSLGTIEQCNIIAQTGATPSGAAVSVQVAGFTNSVTRLQTEIEVQNLETDAYWLGDGETVNQLTAEIPVTTSGISQWGTISTTAQFNSDAMAVVQSLTSTANVVVNGELIYGKGVKASGKDAPDFTLLGSGSSTLTGTIDVLTLGGTVTGVLSDDNGIAYSVGSVVLQSEATVNPLSNQLGLLNLPSWAPSFTAMPGGLFGSLQTTGSGALGNIIFMQGPVAPPPVTFGGGLYIGSLQFGNNSFGNIQFGSGSQLGNLLNQSPFPSTLTFPSGTSSNQLFQNYADTNSGSRITVRIGDDEQQITRNTNIVPVSMKVVTYPSIYGWIGQRSEEYLRNMTVELQYRLMNLTTGEMTDPIVRNMSVRGNEEFSVTPSGFTQTGSHEVEIKHIPTGMIVKLPVKVYQTGDSVLSMGFADLPYVIRDSVTGNGKLAGGRVRGVFVNGVSFDYPIYNGDGLQIGEGLCNPSSFDKRMSGSIKITAIYKGFSASAYIDIGSSTTWGAGFKASVLDELNDWKARLNDYIEPDKSQLSRLIDSITQFVIASTSEGDIVRFMDSFRNQAENLMKTQERIHYNLNMLQILTIKQVKDYWPAKAGGGTYVLTDYSATGLEKIFSVKEYWISSIESAENELQVNGDTENLGMLARAKAEIDAIPRKGDDLNAVWNRFGESPSRTLTRSEGTSADGQTNLVRSELYREMLLLGGDPTWKLSCVRNSETQYTVTLISSESNSLTKTFTIQWNVWETRGSVVSELYLTLNNVYPTWAASKPYAEIYSQFADAVNMNDTEKLAFAFFYDQGLLNGRTQGETQVTMDPNTWITRNQYLQLLTQIEERLLLDLSQSNLPAPSSSDELLASGVEDFVKQTNQLFVTAVSSRLKLVGQYSELPPQLNDSNAQTILLQGQIDLTAGENSNKNIIVLKNAHLTIFNGFQLAMKDQAILLLLGSLTNNGELHIDPDAQFEMRVGAMLNNTARFVNFGRVLINGVTNPNLYNIEHHSIADRMEVILGLYQRFHEGYGFDMPTSADINGYAAKYIDWNEIQSDNPEDIREEAMAWMILNGAYNGRQVSPESNDFVIEPSFRLNRADMAQMLWQFVPALPSALTPVTSPATFSDVAGDDGHYAAVIGLAAAGIFESDGSGLFRANYLVETTRFNWGSELEGLLNRLVAAAGYADSSISLIRILPGENPVYRNLNFMNPVSVYSIDQGDFTNYWGGEARFINCMFSADLKINLVDINYMVNFENAILHNGEVYTTTPDPSQMSAWGYTTTEMMPDPFKLDLRVSLNGIPAGTQVRAGVNTEVTMYEQGTFFINGAQVQSTETVPEGHGVSALIWKECEAQHAPDYHGDHSTCIRDPNNPTNLADKYMVLEVRDQVSQVTLPTPSLEVGASNFGRVVMNSGCPENIRLKFGSYDTVPSIFRINGGKQNTLILEGSLTGNLEVVGKVDLREITVSDTIDIGTWWEETTVNIGSHRVRLIGRGDQTVALTANHQAVVLLTDSNQPYTINNISETDHGFQIGLPHVYGDQGNCGIYIGTENVTDYDFIVSQGSWDEDTNQMTYNLVTMSEQAFVGENKTHLTPMNQNEITDFNQLALSTTWRNGEKTITVILQQIPIKVNYLDRRGFAMNLYGEFRNVYGLADATEVELATMSATYSDWTSLSAEEKPAIAFMFKHQLLIDVAEGELRYVKPQEQVSRGQAAQTLFALANALQQVGTYPNGLNVNVAPDVTFNDVPTGELGTAILSLAKAGVLSSDDAGFRPSEILNDRELRDWIWRLQQNLGPAVSLESSFEVLYGQDLRIENKVFSQEVKVFSDQALNTSIDPWADENHGGDIRFINCVFQGGLTLQLGEVGYTVGLESVQLKDQTLRVTKHDTLTPNPYLNSVRVQINGVTPGTIIDSTSPSGMFNVAISSSQVGDFTLNGIKVESVAPMPQNSWYQAATWKQCTGHHDPNYTGNHNDCVEDPWNSNPNLAKQFMVLEVEGQVARVLPQIGQESKYASVAQYQIRDDNAVNTMELSMQNLAPTTNLLFLQAGKATTWKPVGSSGCDTMVTGNADLTQFSSTGQIRLNNWYNENNPVSQIHIGNHAVIVEGDNKKAIELFATNGARIWSFMQPLSMQLHGPTATYDVGSPHVFGDNGNYAVYLGTVFPNPTGTYTITLEKPVWSDADQKHTWVPIPYNSEAFYNDNKTHLNPTDPMAIEDPRQIRMTVDWINGNDTITVTYEFLPYQQPLANRADVAKTILYTFTERVEKNRISEYGLVIPTYEEITQYAALYTDWQEMMQDADAEYGMALVLKNQLMSPIEQLVKPWEIVTRRDFIQILYSLTQKIETALQKSLPNVYPTASYEDVPSSHTEYASIMYLLQRGIIPNDWTRLEPDMPVNSGELWDWNRRLQEAFGPLETNRTELVLDGSDITISNRVFAQPVTIFTTMTKNVEQPLSNHAENWGGRLELPNCVFQQGLTIILNEVPYEVSMMGSPVTGVIYVQATDNGLAWKFDPDWVLHLSGVANTTVVVSEGNVSVTSGESDGQFNLQGNLIVGNSNLQNQDYFGANVSWICDDYDHHGETNNHSTCDFMLIHQMLGVHGSVKEVQAGVQVLPTFALVQTFELWRTTQNVALKFPTELAYPKVRDLRISVGGWSETNAIFKVSGLVDNDVIVQGKVDISEVTLNEPFRFFVVSWRETPEVYIGNNIVIIEGPNDRNVILHGGSNPVVDLRSSGPLPLTLVDSTGNTISYDVGIVDWNQTPQGEWVVVIGSVDSALDYTMYQLDVESNWSPAAFEKYTMAKEGETEQSITVLVPNLAVNPFEDEVVLVIQKQSYSLWYTPNLTSDPSFEGEVVTTFAELLTAAAVSSDEREIVISQNMTVPDRGSQSWSIEVYRTVVIPDGVTLTLAPGSKMAYGTILNKGSIVVQGATETLNGGYLQGGNITEGSLVSGEGSTSVSVDELGLREALKFNLSSVDISIDKALALSGPLDLARTTQQPPRRIFLFEALSALQDNTALILYQGDYLRNYQPTGHIFYEKDGVTRIPDSYTVIDQMRVFKWKTSSARWIADFDEGTGIPNLPMPA